MSPEELKKQRQQYGVPEQGFGTTTTAAPAAVNERLSALDTAWAATKTKTQFAQDTNADSASFAATGTEKPLAAAAKVVGNIPKSAINFGKGVLEFLNPIAHEGIKPTGIKAVDTAKNIGQEIYDTQESTGYSAGKLALETAKAMPENAYKMLVPQFLKHIFAGDLTKAAATIENDPVGQIAPLLMVAKQTATAMGKGSEFDAAMTKIASPATKSATAVGSFTKDVATGGTRFLGGQLTGLSPDTIQKVVEDPHQFSKSAESLISRPALGDTIKKAIDTKQAALDETGAEYKDVRTSNTPVKVDPNYLDTLIKETTGLNVKDGQLQVSGSAKVRLPGDVSALQNKLYNTWAPEFAKGYLTPDEFLNFRKDMSKMAFNDSGIGKSTDLSNMAEIMRAKANADLRPQIEGLKNIDEHFAPQIEELNQLSKGLVDKNGQLTDSAINKIASATGKGKDPVLARLEQLSPGITDQIKILKAVEDISNSREVKVGTYLRAGALGAGIVSLNPYLIVSAIASIPQVAVPLLRGLGYSKATISKITNTLGIPQTIKGLNKAGEPGVDLAPGATSQTEQKRMQQGKPKASTSSSMNDTTSGKKGNMAAFIGNYLKDGFDPKKSILFDGKPDTPEEKKKLTEMAMNAGSGVGSLERVGATKLAQIASKLHPEDIGIMRDITDYAAKSFKPTAKQASELELAARRIWEKYIKEIVPPKTIKGIANDFGRLLDHVKTEAKDFLDSPAGTKIYRGENAANKGGVSWSFSKAEAQKFAGKDGVVLTSKLPAGGVRFDNPDVQAILKDAMSRGLTTNQMYMLLKKKGYTAILTTDSMTGKPMVVKLQ